MTPDDNDGDLICDDLDTDDDNDGYTDVHETACGTDGMVADDVLTSMGTEPATRWTRTTTTMGWLTAMTGPS